MSCKLFVVEDHQLVREMLVEFLSDIQGWQVCGTAQSAEEALDLLDGLEVDLALIDVSLPGKSGIDLVEEIRLRWPHWPCLMLSGHAERRYVDAAFAAGARGYVVKGDADELADAIERVLEGETYVSASLRAI
jgi:DNA-binding NarL/FixJ family response regulator